MQHRRKADQPDDDQVDRDDVVEKPRHDQDQDAGDQCDQGLRRRRARTWGASGFWFVCRGGVVFVWRGYVTGVGLTGREWLSVFFSSPLQGEGWVGMVWVRCSLFFVIPAKAGIQLFASLSSALTRSPTHVRVRFVRHPWRPSHFLLLAQEKVTKEKGTLATAVAGHPCPATPQGRYGGSLTVRPCTDSERARILRAPLTGFFLRALAAAERDP